MWDFQTNKLHFHEKIRKKNEKIDIVIQANRTAVDFSDRNRNRNDRNRNDRNRIPGFGYYHY